jgi:hypothetical protein
MTERREGENVPETSEQVGNRLLDFIAKAEFGSPEYHAVSDYLYLRDSEASLKQEQRNVLSSADAESKLYWDAKAQISIQKIALHELQIYQKQANLKGYDTAYTHVGIGFDSSLSNAISREAETLHEDETERAQYHSEIYGKYFEDAQEAVDSKRG